MINEDEIYYFIHSKYMQKEPDNKYLEKNLDEIDLLELIRVFINGKWIIIASTVLFSISSILYSLSIPNIYESRALLAPINQSANQTIGSYRQLAGLAGVNLSTPEGSNNSTKALKKLSSLSFFENNILPKIFLPNLMALENWNNETNTISYNLDKYDMQSKTWVGYPSLNGSNSPSPQESFLVFNSLLQISEDSKSGFISLSMTHESPIIAKAWVDIIINEINDFYRLKDKSEAQRAVNYLNGQLSSSQLSEIKKILTDLLKKELQKLTLIEANKDYVFEYIDPPAVMEQKSGPTRSIICILGAFIGFLIGVFVVLIKRYGLKSNER